eukprot:1407510-Amphidinium_carterae.3
MRGHIHRAAGRHSLGMSFGMTVVCRTVKEGSTIVMTAINSNSTKASQLCALPSAFGAAGVGTCGRLCGKR